MLTSEYDDSRELFELVHLSGAPGVAESWELDRQGTVGLPGAHGSELVRSFCIFDDEGLVFTAGEDGCVKAWRPAS